MKMKWEDTALKSPLARARGLGASHEGTEHWLHQRLTAIANVPLVLWLVWSVVHHLQGSGYEEAASWLGQPVNAILMILALLNIFYHAALGARVIVEDYIHTHWFKFIKLVGIRFYFIIIGVVCVFSVLKVAFA